ncbi:TPA: hypothetical protein IGZ61_004827 [Escherichia coli]|nr:hypothetical protein [Escherichia coli]
MQKTISDFFHCLGIVFAFTFLAFWLIMDNNPADDSLADTLAPFSVCIFIYCTARFTGRVVNGLIRN